MRAVVLYQMHGTHNARVVAYCPRLACAAAALWSGDPLRAAIRPGMPLAEATALAGDSRGLHLECHDPLADRLALDELAEWCQCFSPTVGLEEAEPAESLLLDVTGLDRLASEQALAERVVQAFGERGLSVRVAIADTVGAAWGIAHHAPLELPADTRDPQALTAAIGVPVVVPAGQILGAIASLPVEALRLSVATCALLAELGLCRVEHVAALPRATLRSRFGPLVLERLDQATGAAAEAIVARAVPQELEFEWLFEHPTGRREAIEFALTELIGRACDSLARQRRGVLRLECRFEHENQPALQFLVGLYRASATARHVAELAHLKLERSRFCEPVVAVRVTVLAFDALEFRQQEFFAQEAGASRESPRELAALVDRLSNRLGSQAVLRPWLLAGAQPEFACQFKPLTSSIRRARKKTRAALPAPAAIAGDRPLHLAAQPARLSVMSVAPEGPPVQFRLAGREERIVRAWGPERIETGWWRTRCVRRDYYQVETTRGERFWLFRQLNTGHWFLHGEFA